MTVHLFEPPDEDYARRLLHFLRHKDDDSLRGIRQRALGQYADKCLDHYFVGEVEGQMVGQAWYGLPRPSAVSPTRGIGNFGHVYTNPEWRGQGVAGHLVRILVGHFDAEPAGSCLLCSAGAQAGRIYQKHGFQFLPPTAQSGPMGLIRTAVARSFAELDELYFAPGQQVSVEEGHIGHRHDLDRMLDFSARWIAARARWHFVALASHVPTFISALHYVEDGRGLIRVLKTNQGSVVGYGFALNLGSRFEQGLKTCDFVIHPHYLEHAPLLLGEVLQAAAEPVHAVVAAGDRDKLAALKQAGFGEIKRFAAAFAVAGQAQDVVLLRWP